MKKFILKKLRILYRQSFTLNFIPFSFIIFLKKKIEQMEINMIIK